MNIFVGGTTTTQLLWHARKQWHADVRWAKKESCWTFWRSPTQRRPSRLLDFLEAPDDISLEPPTMEEIVLSRKSRKEGTGSWPVMSWRRVIQSTPWTLFMNILIEKKSSNDWCKGIIVKIPKKGDLTNCDNRRGINLLSVPRKVLCKITIRRIPTAV